MAQFTVNAQRFDPYKNFKFRVKWDGRYVAGVSKVGALKRTTEVVEHREGGDPQHEPQVAGPHRSTRRSRSSAASPTTPSSSSGPTRSGTSAPASARRSRSKDFRKDIIIEVYNEAGSWCIAYKVYRCWVSEYQALPDLDANANAVAIQHIKLENEGWERDYEVVEPAEPSSRSRRRGSASRELSAAATLELWDAARARCPGRARARARVASGGADAGGARARCRRAARRAAARAARGARRRRSRRRRRARAAASGPSSRSSVDALLARADAPRAADGSRRRVVEWRSPDSRDVAAAAEAVDAADGRARAARALRRRRRSSTAGRARAPSRAAMAEADPLAEVLVDIACPACGEAFVADLDVGAVRLGGGARARARLLREVDALARAYGWTEARGARARRRAAAPRTSSSCGGRGVSDFLVAARGARRRRAAARVAEPAFGDRGRARCAARARRGELAQEPPAARATPSAPAVRSEPPRRRGRLPVASRASRPALDQAPERAASRESPRRPSGRQRPTTAASAAEPRERRRACRAPPSPRRRSRAGPSPRRSSGASSSRASSACTRRRRPVGRRTSRRVRVHIGRLEVRANLQQAAARRDAAAARAADDPQRARARRLPPRRSASADEHAARDRRGQRRPAQPARQRARSTSARR